MGSGPNYGVNVAAGTSRPAVTVKMACRRNHHSELCMEKNKIIFLKALAIAKTWFSM
jgi:hypothetical protein